MVDYRPKPQPKKSLNGDLVRSQYSPKNTQTVDFQSYGWQTNPQTGVAAKGTAGAALSASQKYKENYKKSNK